MSIGTAMGAAMSPLTFTSTATRHALDVVTMGQVSTRYNARDKYRNEYSPTQRAGAGFGVAAGTAIPAVALAKWWKNGHVVPQALENAPRWGKGAAAIVAGGVGLSMVGVGALKTSQLVSDDGNLGALGTSVGVLGGAAAGTKIGSIVAKGSWRGPAIGGLVGMVSAGVLTGMAARHVKIGTSKIGQPHEQAPNVDSSVGERSASFAQGMWNHFSEFGPVSQGEASAQAWGMRDTYREKYSNAERGGALDGDLLAAGAMGAAAAGVTAALLGSPSMRVRTADGHVMSGAVSAADRASRYTHVGAVNIAARTGLQLLERTPGRSGAGLAIAAGVLGTGLIAERESEAWKDQHHHTGGGGAAALVGASTAGLATALSRTEAFAHASKWNRVGGAMVAASGIIGVLSAARIGLQAFHADAKDAQAITPADSTTRTTMEYGIGAVGAGIGLMAGLKRIPSGGLDVAIPFIKRSLHVPKVAGVGFALAGAGAVGAMAGSGVSPTLPSLQTVGVAAAAGAAVAGVGVIGLRGLTQANMASVLARHPEMVQRGLGRAMDVTVHQPVKLAAVGATGGAVAGAMSSSVWKRDSVSHD